MADADARAGSERLAATAIPLAHLCDARAVTPATGCVAIPLKHVDRLITAVAVEQDAVVTYAQLRALGVGRGAIAIRRQRGLLQQLHVGVYRWGPMESVRTRVRAAVLACGDDALATHQASLALHGVLSLPDGPIDVTTIGRHVAPRGVRPHRIKALDRADQRALRGIPVTAPARALLEVAAELTPRELANLVERAQVDRLVTKAQILAAIDRAPRRPGAAALRTLAEDPQFTRSRAERKLLALLRAARLPEPACNAKVAGWEVDAFWERERVILEFDSYGFHATRAAFERDRRKTSDLTRGRHLVLRSTWTELTKHPFALIARIAEALSAGARTASPARAGP